MTDEDRIAAEVANPDYYPSSRMSPRVLLPGWFLDYLRRQMEIGRWWALVTIAVQALRPVPGGSTSEVLRVSILLPSARRNEYFPRVRSRCPVYVGSDDEFDYFIAQRLAERLKKSWEKK